MGALGSPKWAAKKIKIVHIGAKWIINIDSSPGHLKGVLAPQTNFVTVCAFFSIITTYL